MTETVRKVEDFASRGDYYKYRQDLATKVLLAYGVLFGGKSFGRVQTWCEQDLNLNDDDMITARNESKSTGRFRYDRGYWILTPGALPATEAEQQVIDIVQKVTEGVDVVSNSVEAEVMSLRVPNVSTRVSDAWNEQMAAYWRQG